MLPEIHGRSAAEKSAVFAPPVDRDVPNAVNYGIESNARRSKHYASILITTAWAKLYVGNLLTFDELLDDE